MWRAKIELARSSPDYHLTVGNRDAGLGFDRLLGRRPRALRSPRPRSTSTSSTRPGRRSIATAERARLEVPPDARLIVGVGQLIDRKGIDVLIDALARRSGPVRSSLRWFGAGEAR